jgi:hypothetical protein
MFGRSSDELLLADIRAIGHSQGLIGKMFDFGDVDISTAGVAGGEIRSINVAMPDHVKRLISDAKNRYS